MGPEGPASDLYRFGLFEADRRHGRLLRNGARVKIQEQPFRVLLSLLERAGEIVSREELRQELWPSDTYVEFDGSLNAALKKLRYALNDSADNPTFIETVPKRGYRFIAPVQRPATAGPSKKSAAPTVLPVDLAAETPPLEEGAIHRGGLSLATATRPEPSEPMLLPFPVPKQTTRRSRVSQLALAGLAVAVGAGVYGLWPTRPPRVLRRVQLTHFGRAGASWGMATDGARIFFSEVKGGRSTIDQVPVGGGEPTPFPLPFANEEVFDISPDHTELLIASFTGLTLDETIWVVPVTGGAPRRLGDALGSSGAWSPDGQTIAYTRGSDVYTVHRDGNAARRLASIPGCTTGRVRWSPSGKWLRFTITGGNTPAPQWEVAPDGSGLHPIPATGQGEVGQGYGSWTPDGRYFVYQSFTAGVASVWAIREFGGIFRGLSRKPVEIYAGPTAFYGPLPSIDGKRILLIEEQGRSELVRYDFASRQFVPYLGGIPARHLFFSRDGKQVAYILGADNELWVAKWDGSDAHRLSFPPMVVFTARFSPNGRQIAFDGGVTRGQAGIYVMPPEGGGKPELVLAQHEGGLAGWSADGQSLLIWRPTVVGASFAMYALNLKSGELTLLPGSEGLHHGLASPDGRYIAALSVGNESVLLYDLQTHQHTELAKGNAIVNPFWSADGQTVFFQDMYQGSEEPIYSVGIDHPQAERVANSAQPFATDVTSCRLTGITPENVVLATLNRSNSDLYALDVDFP